MFDAMVNQRIDTEGLNIDVSYYDIQELNERAIRGEAEFSKISCAIIPTIDTQYQISRSGAAIGRGNGPLLVRRKGESRPITTVAIPGVHTTANNLVRKLFPEITDRREMLFSTIAQAVERGDVDAGVLIHEGRFLYQKHNLELVADLGELWEHRFNLPLPLGAIAIRRDIDDEVKLKFQRVLKHSIEYAFENPLTSREYIKMYAQELDDNVIDAHIKLFVNNFSVDISDEGISAIDALR